MKSGYGVLEIGTYDVVLPAHQADNTTLEGLWQNNQFCVGLAISGKPKNFVVSSGHFHNRLLSGEGVRQCFLDGKLLRYEAYFVDGKVSGYGHYTDSANTRCVAKWAGQGYEGPVIQTHSTGSTGILFVDNNSIMTVSNGGLVINTFKDGRCYEGEYRDSHWHGYGIETLKGTYAWAGLVSPSQLYKSTYSYIVASRKATHWCSNYLCRRQRIPRFLERWCPNYCSW